MAPAPSSTSLRHQKVARIFHRFDENRDGGLDRTEMSSLVVAVNPRVHFSDDQIAAILDEVFRTYGDYIDGQKGLTFEGLLQTYDDGAGDVDRDFDALNLDLASELGEEENEVAAAETDEIASSRRNAAVSSSGDDRQRSAHSRRKRSVGSWAGSPKNGIAYDETWRLVEDLEMVIRKLEMKLEAKQRRSRGGWEDGSDALEAMASRRRKALEEASGPDYANFLKGLGEIRERANGARTREEAFDAHMAMGRSLFEHKLYGESLANFKKASELKPTDVRPHFQCGNALYSLNKISEARECYTLALEAAQISAGGGSQWDSLLPQIHVNLGIALEGDGMLLSASEHYKEAAIREPRHYRALKHLGSALYGAGEYKAAQKALCEAIFLNPDYADAHCELGSTLHALGDHEDAIREFEKAIELKHDHIEALFNLATLLKDIRRFQSAADMYAKVLALQNDHWRAELNRAVSLLGAGRIEEAKKSFKSAYKMTKRSDLYDAIVHLKQMEKRPKGLMSFLRRGEENEGSVGDSFRAEDNCVVVEMSRFRRANATTTPRHWLECALEIRKFQRSTRLNKCDVSMLKRQLSNNNLPVSLSGVSASEKSIRKEALEKVLRQLLPFLQPEAFQGAMKCINERILTLLDTAELGRVDLGMAFALLAPVCGGPLDKRKRTAFDVLIWRSSANKGGEISRADAYLFLRNLRAAYLSATNDSPENNPGNDQDSISFPEFLELFDSLELGFGILNILARLEKEDKVCHRYQTCSVCSYPVVGPRFKEVRAKFVLCSICYSSGKVPSASKQEEYCFKEYNSEVDAVKDRLKIFKRSCPASYL